MYKLEVYGSPDDASKGKRMIFMREVGENGREEEWVVGGGGLDSEGSGEDRMRTGAGDVQQAEVDEWGV